MLVFGTKAKLKASPRQAGVKSAAGQPAAKNKAVLTPDEKIKIVYNIHYYTITHFNKETLPLAAAMCREMVTVSSQRTRVLYAHAKAAFYIYYSK